MVTKLDLRRNKTMTDELTKTFFDISLVKCIKTKDIRK